MTNHQLEEAIAHQYDNGRYSPLGADGGVLKYIMVNVDGKTYNASITLDSEIASIRRIWQLSEVTANNVKLNELYDFTNTYYEIRNI